MESTKRRTTVLILADPDKRFPQNNGNELDSLAMEFCERLQRLVEPVGCLLAVLSGGETPNTRLRIYFEQIRPDGALAYVEQVRRDMMAVAS